MTPQPDIADEIQEAPAPDDFARPVLERQMARLERVAAVGERLLDTLEKIADRALAAAEPDPTFDVERMSAAYHRTARAIRMTCALQTRVIDLIRDLPRHAANAERFRAAEVAAQALMPQTPLQIRKTEIGQALSSVLDHEHRSDLGSEAHERHVREATERLKDADDLGDILTRPISDIIAQVCKDLGLEPDWEGLASEAWALEAARKNKGRASSQSQPVFSSPACGGGGPAQPVEGAQPPPDPPPSAPSVTAQERRATFPAGGEGEEVEPPEPPFEPPPPPPYYPPKLEDIYSAEAYARSNGRTPTLNYDPAGLPGELPPPRRDGRPPPHILPPCNYDHGCFD